MSEPRRLYRSGEVAERLSVSVATVWRWRRAGLLPRGYEAPGLGWLVDSVELDTIEQWASRGGRPRAGRPALGAVEP